MNMPLDQVAVIALVAVLLLGTMELLRQYMLKIEKLKVELMHARGKNHDLEVALKDIVDTFGENGVNMHRNAFEKITSISRGRALIGRVTREEIESGGHHA